MSTHTNRAAVIIIAAACALAGQGCADPNGRRITVFDSRTGTESEAVTLTLNNDGRYESLKEEAERSFVGNGDIIAITSDVEIFEVVVEVSRPVNGGYLTTWNRNSEYHGDAIAEVSSNGTVLTFRSRNGGFINATTAVKEELQYTLYLDTRGLDGETFTLSVTEIAVKIGTDRSLRRLSVTGATKTVTVAEPPKVTGVPFQTSYTYAGRGIGQEVALFALGNQSVNQSATVYEIFVVTNASGLNLRLTDGNGNTIAAATDDQSGGYSFRVAAGTEPNLIIPAGGSNMFRLVADTNGASINGPELMLQVSGLAARADNGLTKWINNPIPNNGGLTTFLTSF